MRLLFTLRRTLAALVQKLLANVHKVLHDVFGRKVARHPNTCTDTYARADVISDGLDENARIASQNDHFSMNSMCLS